MLVASLLKNLHKLRSTKECLRSISTKQLIIQQHGNPEDVVEVREHHMPLTKCDEVMVRMLAAPIHPADINIIQGSYGIKPEMPHVLGNEGVGEVISSKSPLFKLGDRVIPNGAGQGTWQTCTTQHPSDFIKISPDLSVEDAATFATNPGTAYRMLSDFVKLSENDAVIQNGANSAVGRAVIQLCREWGIRSVNVVRDRPDIKELKAELLDLGADEVVTEEELRALRGDPSLKSLKLALNCVCGRSAAELTRHLGEGAVMVTYGGMSRQPLTIPVGNMIFNDLSLRGYWHTKWASNPYNRMERTRMLEALTHLVLEGKFRQSPSKLVPFDDYKTALKCAMPSEGKIGLKPLLIFDN